MWSSSVKQTAWNNPLLSIHHSLFFIRYFVNKINWHWLGKNVSLSPPITLRYVLILLDFICLIQFLGWDATTVPALSRLMTALKTKKWTALLDLIDATEEKSSMISIHKQSRLTEKAALLPRSVQTRMI